MMTSTTKVTYYNRLMWRTTTLPDGTRLVQPVCRDENGSLVARAEVRRYRKPTSV